MVWTHLKNEQREYPKEGFEHEIKREMPKTKTQTKLGTTG
jgi:hypothetical protein